MLPFTMPPPGPEGEKDTELIITCSRCRMKISIKFNFENLRGWVRGELIQNAFPYLNVGEREIMISQLCSRCCDEITYDYRDDVISEEL
jgi:hypothetical protein